MSDTYSEFTMDLPPNGIAMYDPERLAAMNADEFDELPEDTPVLDIILPTEQQQGALSAIEQIRDAVRKR